MEFKENATILLSAAQKRFNKLRPEMPKDVTSEQMFMIGFVEGSSFELEKQIDAYSELDA